MTRFLAMLLFTLTVFAQSDELLFTTVTTMKQNKRRKR
jgi:hypothetical protein